MSALLTIKAQPIEGIINGEVGAVSVLVNGAEALSADTVREIAQEAVDSYYGNYSHGRVAALGYNTWRDADTKESYMLPVVSRS